MIIAGHCGRSDDREPELSRFGLAAARRHLGPHASVSAVLAAIEERVVLAVDACGTRAIVKVDTAEYRFEREIRALELAHAHLLPVPRVLFSEPGPPAVFGLSRLEGVPLTAVDSRPAWIAAGTALRAIHELPVESIPQFDWMGSDWREFVVTWLHESLAWIRETGFLAIGQIDRLAAIGQDGFNRLRQPRRVVLHGDCQPFHYLVDPVSGEVTGILDFGDAGTGDPLWDIATICVDRRRRPWVLRGYGHHGMPDDCLDQILDAYYVLRHISAVGWLVENNLDPAPSVALLEAMAAG